MTELEIKEEKSQIFQNAPKGDLPALSLRLISAIGGSVFAKSPAPCVSVRICPHVYRSPVHAGLGIAYDSQD